MPPYQPLNRSISGHKALITGAASGMGRATAYLFASEVARVAVTDLDQARCEKVIQEIEAAGFTGMARGFAINVLDADGIAAVVPEIP